MAASAEWVRVNTSAHQIAAEMKREEPPIAVRCRNIAKVWIGSLDDCLGPVRIFSPYLTSRLADQVLVSDAPNRVEVHTRFDVEAFASGASCLGTLRTILKRGFPLFDVPRLHAKLFEHPNGFATIGSQNMTQRGTSNREASVVVRDPFALASLRKQVSRWIADRREITVEMVDEAEEAIHDLQKQYRALQRACREIEQRTLAAQSRRDLETRKKASAPSTLPMKKPAEAGIPASSEGVADWLQKLGENGRVPFEVCWRVAARAMVWKRWGQLVQCPGDAKYLDCGPYGWELRLGKRSANGFAVEYAVRLCRDRLRELANEYAFEESGLAYADFCDLESRIAYAFVGRNGGLYTSGYPAHDLGVFWLGSHGVRAMEVVAAILDSAEIAWGTDASS